MDSCRVFLLRCWLWLRCHSSAECRIFRIVDKSDACCPHTPHKWTPHRYHTEDWWVRADTTTSPLLCWWLGLGANKQGYDSLLTSECFLPGCSCLQSPFQDGCHGWWGERKEGYDDLFPRSLLWEPGRLGEECEEAKPPVHGDGWECYTGTCCISSLLLSLALRWAPWVKRDSSDEAHFVNIIFSKESDTIDTQTQLSTKWNTPFPWLTFFFFLNSFEFKPRQ